MHIVNVVSAPVEASAGTLTAVVTGATGGIGREIVRGLLALGARVVVGVRSLDKAEALRSELLGGSGGELEILPLDLSNMQSVRAFAAQVADAHPKL